jgi:hypothetical protein
MKSERQMSAPISPSIVQLAFGFRNLACARWLPGQVATEDIEMLMQKSVFSVHGRAAVIAAVAAAALTAVEPSLALAGPAPRAKACRRRARPATPPTSAPAAGSIGAVAPPQPPLLPVLSGPALRSPRPRAALATTATAARSITAQIRIITAVVPIITADMAMAACPITGAIP